MGESDETKKNNPDRPWAGLDIPVHPNTSALFAISAVTTMGNGSNTLFWMDCWLLGTSLAPNVHKSVPTRVRNSRTIADALIDHSWVSDIRGALSWHGLMEYLELCDAVSNIQLNTIEDQNVWKHENSGIFSSKSAYRSFFVGAIELEPWKRIWKTYAPNKCKIFVWLAVRNCCWTADRLQKRGLPHPDRCPLCD